MTPSQVIVAIAAVILLIPALLAFMRLAKGPTGLDRGIASDVLIAVLIASICAHAVWFRTSVALIIILVLSLVGFTTAVGLARLITGATARERSFLEAEARAAYLNDPGPQATTGDRTEAQVHALDPGRVDEDLELRARLRQVRDA